MKKLFAAAAGIAALTAGTAQAAPTITYTTQPDGSFSSYFGNAPKVASFSDLFTTFTISNARGGTLFGTLSTSGLASTADVDFVTAQVLGPNGFSTSFNILVSALTGKVSGKTVTNPDGFEFGDISGVHLDPGVYQLKITGKTSGKASTGSYAGTLDFVPTPAPEPAAWALMILGFGAIGFAMRRQRSAQPQVTYS